MSNFDFLRSEWPALQESLAGKDRAFDESQQKLADTEEKLQQLQAEIKKLQRQNALKLASIRMFGT